MTVTAVDLIGREDLDAPGVQARLETLASMTAAAYGRALVAGLPPADGTATRTADLLAHLESGGMVALVDHAGGALAGAVVAPDGEDWGISRLAVEPTSHGRGMAGQLLERLVGHALDHGATALVLDAVVERRLPQVYARHGFAVVDHWAAPDKLLTEVTMRRDLTRPAASHDGVLDLWPGPRTARHALMWLDDPDGVVGWVTDRPLTPRAALDHVRAAWRDARARRQGTGDRPEVLGVDVWTGEDTRARAAAMDRALGSGPRIGSGLVRTTLSAPPVMPRTLHPDLWAAVRVLPGRSEVL